MVAKWIETLTGSLEQKKQYKQDKGRLDALPEPYRTAGKAMHRYFMYYGGITDGDILTTALREIVGDDPIEFAETFAQAYTGKHWLDKERARLTKAIEGAARAEQQ